MRTKISLFAGCLAMGLLSGCLTFTGTQYDGDNLTDDANMPFVAKQVKDAEGRVRFKVPVEVKMSEKGYRFIAPGYRPAGAAAMPTTPQFRKDLMATAQSALEKSIGAIKDFQLVNSEAGVIASPGVTVSDVAPNSAYTFTFGISNVDVKDYQENVSIGVDVASDIAILTGASYNTTRAIRTAKKVHWYYVDVTVDVALTAPNGNRVFHFEKSVRHNKKIMSRRPDVTLVKEAVANAIKQAMSEYVIEFGPPLYVDQTSDNGKFVRLSAGSNYGIQKGQTVMFFRHKEQKMPTLPGEPQKVQVVKQRVGTGVVGDKNAPVDKEHAWVYVSANADSDRRTVFLWTSAKIVKE